MKNGRCYRYISKFMNIKILKSHVNLYRTSIKKHSTCYGPSTLLHIPEDIGLDCILLLLFLSCMYRITSRAVHDGSVKFRHSYYLNLRHRCVLLLLLLLLLRPSFRAAHAFLLYWECWLQDIKKGLCTTTETSGRVRVVNSFLATPFQVIIIVILVEFQSGINKKY